MWREGTHGGQRGMQGFEWSRSVSEGHTACRGLRERAWGRGSWG